MHYDKWAAERVDWSYRGFYMQRRHGISPRVANDVLDDPNRVVIDPDCNSKSGRSSRIIGYSTIVEEVVTVIVYDDEGIPRGVNGWVSNGRDRRIYKGGSYERD